MKEDVRGVRGLLVSNEKSVAERMRRRRWALLQDRVPDLVSLRILDLGGVGMWWANAPVRPRHVTLINLAVDPPGAFPDIVQIEGDALRADELVAGETFDLVFSNSLMEHLGGHGPRRRFADVVRSLAPRYVVQTPYRYFPVEPHWMFPAFQLRPVRARAYLAPRWPLGHTRGWDPGDAVDEVMATDLISASEMRVYFPDAAIVWERVGGIPKSMIAIR
jgi:hypothetical protein